MDVNSTDLWQRWSCPTQSLHKREKRGPGKRRDLLSRSRIIKCQGWDWAAPSLTPQPSVPHGRSHGFPSWWASPRALSRWEILRAFVMWTILLANSMRQQLESSAPLTGPHLQPCTCSPHTSKAKQVTTSISLTCQAKSVHRARA